MADLFEGAPPEWLQNFGENAYQAMDGRLMNWIYNTATKNKPPAIVDRAGSAVFNAMENNQAIGKKIGSYLGPEEGIYNDPNKVLARGMQPNEQFNEAVSNAVMNNPMYLLADKHLRKPGIEEERRIAMEASDREARRPRTYDEIMNYKEPSRAMAWDTRMAEEHPMQAAPYISDEDKELQRVANNAKAEKYWGDVGSSIKDRAETALRGLGEFGGSAAKDK